MFINQIALRVKCASVGIFEMCPDALFSIPLNLFIIEIRISLDYSRVKNAVRSDDDVACEGVLKYVEQAVRKPMR